MKNNYIKKKILLIVLVVASSFGVIFDLAKHQYAQFSPYSILILVGLIAYLGYNLWRNGFDTLENVSVELENVIKGSKVFTASIAKTDATLAQEIDKLSSITLQATKYTQAIGKEDSVIELDQTIPINSALTEMQGYLKRLNEEEQKRNWVIQGTAELGDVIRQHLDSKVEVLTDLFLHKLIKYLNANQAGIYLVNEDQEGKFIELKACYAYDRKKFHHKRLEWGEGLVGECIRDAGFLFLTDIPDNYMSITSGIGSANPKNIVLCPLKTNEKTIGAIEIASFEVMQSHKTELIERVCESLATTIVTVQNNARNLELLDKAKNVEQDLKEKENAMLQANEELNATQEELSRRLVDIQVESNLNRNILEAINKSNAMVEYDMQGRVLDVNDLYLNVMGYKKEELIGKTEAHMLPNDEMTRQNLEMLWTSLAQGQFNSGQFKRLTKNRNEIWIEASFNPIVDINGNLSKVLMFAQFISDIMERENELKNKISVLNEALPYAELDEDWKIKNANPLFMSTFSLTRKTTRGYELISYLAKQVETGQDFTAYFKRELGTQKSFRTEIDCLLQDGKTHHLYFVFNPLKDLNGKVIATGIIINEYPEQHSNSEIQLKIV